MDFVTDWTAPDPGLELGIYEVVMASNMLVNGDTWNFAAQVDPVTQEVISTNPITTGDHTLAGTTLAYKYELLMLTAIQVHAFLDGAPAATDGLIDGQPISIPEAGVTAEVTSGPHTIQVNLEGFPPYIAEVTVAEGQTIRVDAQFATPLSPWGRILQAWNNLSPTQKGIVISTATLSVVSGGVFLINRRRG